VGGSMGVFVPSELAPIPKSALQENHSGG
jgi:hypothetical protein